MMKPAILAALALCGMASTASATVKNVEVCNYTGQTVNVAFGWSSYSLYISKGWFPLDNQRCMNLPAEDSDRDGHIFGYAFGVDGREYVPQLHRSHNLCIHETKPFRYYETGCLMNENMFNGKSTWAYFKEMPPLSFFGVHWDIR